MPPPPRKQTGETMLKPLPREIAVRGLTYRVELGRLDDDAEVDQTSQVIRISRDRSREAQWLALIHETLEAISDPNNLLLPEHDKLSVLAEHLTAALRSTGLLGSG